VFVIIRKYFPREYYNFINLINFRLFIL